jgi:type II secretion system protein H
MILQHCHKHSGFSLIELMIALAIFGIIATVAAPNFQSWSRNYRLKSAANDLYSHMQMAKIGAVKENRPWTVNFNPSGYKVQNSSDPAVPPVKTVDFGAKYSNAIQYKSPTSSTSYDSATLTFNPNGTSSSGFAYISNKAGSGYYRVGLCFSNGSIILQKWNGSPWNCS